MKVTYDVRTDVLHIQFSDTPVVDSYEDKPGIILDYAEDGKLVGMDILDASKQVGTPNGVEYVITGMKK